jgi:hypothetical protein
LAAATSASSIRGYSCVSGDTLITVRNKITGEVKQLPISQFSNHLNMMNADSSNGEENDVQI